MNTAFPRTNYPSADADADHDAEPEAAPSSLLPPPNTHPERQHHHHHRPPNRSEQRGRKRHSHRPHLRHHPHSPELDETLAYEKFTAKLTLICCVFRPTDHAWTTAPLSFDRLRATDRDVWLELRRVYREELQQSWRRWVLFQKLVTIVPIEYTHNGVPVRTKPDAYPNRHSFMHAYHHPWRVRPDRLWVEWFVALRERGDPGKTVGLEFVEGLWVEKLAVCALMLTGGMIFACVLWSVLGGDLQTIFTVMDFVESGLAAVVALLALYYQMVLVS